MIIWAGAKSSADAQHRPDAGCKRRTAQARIHPCFRILRLLVEDARLVVLNASGARAKGADIRTRTRCVSARRENGLWQLIFEHQASCGRATVSARALVNTAGPWVSEVLGSVIGVNEPDKIRLVKGSHIVVDKLYDHDRCYIFQNADGRIFSPFLTSRTSPSSARRMKTMRAIPASRRFPRASVTISWPPSANISSNPSPAIAFDGHIPASGRSTTTVPRKRKKRRVTMCSSSMPRKTSRRC